MQKMEVEVGEDDMVVMPLMLIMIVLFEYSLNYMFSMVIMIMLFDYNLNYMFTITYFHV
jgi:hypothetical protein